MTLSEAKEILLQLKAPRRLVQHVELVGEAGELILAALKELEVAVDEDFVRAGITLHDVGKTLYPNELDGKGSEHEPAGKRLLLERGVDAHLAEVCVTHASWQQATTLEELVIACADKLWKGKRVSSLEELLLKQVSSVLKRDFWDVFSELDMVFENVAAGGDNRLQRSRSILG